MTGAPVDLRTNPDARGPAGTELMGVSVALPLREVADWGQGEWEAAVRHYQPEMLEKLRQHVGGSKPATMPQLNVDGPHSDPLQGQLYVMTAAAWFFPEALPIDCTARKARAAEAAR